MDIGRRLYPQEMAKIIEAQQSMDRPELSGYLDLSVTIGIISFNRWRLTKRCLDSIYSTCSYPFNVIIIDNDSEKETIEFLQHAVNIYPNLQVIFDTKNYGLSIARNKLVEEAKTDAVFFLDNDIICHSNWLEEAVKVSVKYDAAFVASMRLQLDGTVWGLGTDLIRSEGGSVIEIARWFHDLPPEIVVKMMDGGECTGTFLSGGAGMVRIRDFQKVGGFDESYFLGLGDLDFSLMLTEAGFKVYSSHLSWLTHDDQWRPQSKTEEAYVQNRFNIDRLDKQAEYFHSRWNADPLPTKYRQSIDQIIRDKLDKPE